MLSQLHPSLALRKLALPLTGPDSHRSATPYTLLHSSWKRRSHPLPQVWENWPCWQGQRRTGSSVRLRRVAPVAQADQLSCHPGPHPSRGLAHSRIYPICDLMEPVKGPGMWNNSAGYLRGVLVRARESGPMTHCNEH